MLTDLLISRRQNNAVQRRPDEPVYRNAKSCLKIRNIAIPMIASCCCLLSVVALGCGVVAVVQNEQKIHHRWEIITAGVFSSLTACTSVAITALSWLRYSKAQNTLRDIGCKASECSAIIEGQNGEQGLRFSRRPAHPQNAEGLDFTPSQVQLYHALYPSPAHDSIVSLYDSLYTQYQALRSWRV